MNIVEGIYSAALSLLIVAVASFVIIAREHFAAIVGFVAYGLLIALAWMGLFAPDVALDGSRCWRRRDRGIAPRSLRQVAWRDLRGRAAPTNRTWRGSCPECRNHGRVDWSHVAPAGTCPTLAPSAKESLGSTGLANAVTAVLMVYRALDTMLEKVVLLLALVAVWSLAADRFWGGRPAFGLRAEPSGPLIFLARMLIPIGIMMGIYLFWVGADAPGSAFAGGAVLSAMAILGYLAGVYAVPAASGFLLRLSLAVGVAVFLLVGLAGLATGSGFLTYPENFAKPVIVVIEIAMTLSIAMTLALLVVGPPGKLPER